MLAHRVATRGNGKSWTRAKTASVLCVLLSSSSCSASLGAKGEWATKLEPAPKGLALEPPPPKDVYWVAIASAKVPARNRGGQLWDEVGGWPDPLAVLYVDDTEVMSAEAASDTLTPKWDSPKGNVRIPDGATLRVEVADDDGLQDLPIGKATHGPPTATDLSEGRMVLSLGNRAELVLRVEPAHGLMGLGFDYQVVSGVTVVEKVLEHSPAGRAGLEVGDQIVAVGDRQLSDASSAAVESTIDSIGNKPTRVVVKHKSGTSETFAIGVGAVYPLYDEYGDVD
jgi:hypothetical protein